jgi:hypothetical protein
MQKEEEIIKDFTNNLKKNERSEEELIKELMISLKQIANNKNDILIRLSSFLRGRKGVDEFNDIFKGIQTNKMYGIVSLKY